VNLYLVRNGETRKDSLTLEFLIDGQNQNNNIKKLTFVNFFDLDRFLKSSIKFVSKPLGDRPKDREFYPLERKGSLEDNIKSDATKNQHKHGEKHKHNK